MTVASAIVTTSLWAQAQRSHIDVQKYVIEADVNPRTQSLVATAKVNFTALENLNDATFELNNALTVSKATDAAGNTLETSRNPQDFTVRVMVPAMQKGQNGEIDFNYSGKLTGNEDSPVNGLKFAALHPDFGYLMYPARWFPVSGYTTDRFAADLHITTPPEYHVIASGDMKSDRAANGGTTYAFHYDNASFPGSIAVVRGDGVRVLSQGIASDVFFRDQQAAAAQAYGDEAGKIMTFFTSEYGLAPQAKLAIVETEAGAINGYAAPGLVFLAPSAISTTRVNARVLSNQLSRQWWGVLVSPTTRNHLWLENGPARYSELLYQEHTAGPAAMESEVQNTYIEALTVKDPPVLQAARLEDYSPEYWALTAAKGAAVLNMLRNVVGDANFKKGMHAFMDQYGWKSANSEEFRKVMEQASNEDLRYFFIQWLESSGSPDFKLDYTIFRTQQGFRVVGKVTQDLDTFRMPVDLRIETEGNPEDKKIEVTGTSSEFSVDTFGKPRKLILDPNHVLLRVDPQIQVKIAIRRGEQFVAINDFPNALREYQKALEVNRNSSLAHYRIGELFFKQNNFQSAANEFRAAINGDLEPRWTEVWSHVNLGKIFDVTGQRDRAVNEYKLAIRTHDNTAGAQEQAAQYSTKPYEQQSSET
jgi:tetratricopeptide (TPR) repeat protein